MLFENAVVHDHFEPRGARPGGGIVVDYTLLHPHALRADANGGIDNFGNALRAAEYIHDIDWPGISSSDA